MAALGGSTPSTSVAGDVSALGVKVLGENILASLRLTTNNLVPHQYLYSVNVMVYNDRSWKYNFSPITAYLLCHIKFMSFSPLKEVLLKWYFPSAMTIKRELNSLVPPSPPPLTPQCVCWPETPRLPGAAWLCPFIMCSWLSLDGAGAWRWPQIMLLQWIRWEDVWRE